jgi:hypothetical protein
MKKPGTKATAKPHIVFEPTIFARDAVLEKWPHLHKVITSGDQLASAFEEVKKSSVWRRDPRLRDIKPETVDEVLELYNDVIEDGRYVADFLTKPAEVARKLGHEPSKKAVDVVVAAGKSSRSDAGVVGAAVVVSVAVVGAAVTTAIVSSHADRRDRILVDESGRVKLGDRAKMKKKKTKNLRKHV